MEGSSGSDRTVRLTPNYVLMKINRYICRSVVSLWTFPRITHAVRLLPPPPPPSLQLSSFLRSIALSLCSTPPVWFSQRDTSVYLSISVYPILFPPPPSLSLDFTPHDLDLESNIPPVFLSVRPYVPSWTINFNLARISFKSRIRRVGSTRRDGSGETEELMHLSDNHESIINRDSIIYIYIYIYIYIWDLCIYL